MVTKNSGEGRAKEGYEGEREKRMKSNHILGGQKPDVMQQVGYSQWQDIWNTFKNRDGRYSIFIFFAW